jgi:hypothetical protein
MPAASRCAQATWPAGLGFTCGAALKQRGRLDWDSLAALRSSNVAGWTGIHLRRCDRSAGASPARTVNVSLRCGTPAGCSARGGSGSGGLRTAAPCSNRPATRFDACGIPLRPSNAAGWIGIHLRRCDRSAGASPARTFNVSVRCGTPAGCGARGGSGSGGLRTAAPCSNRPATRCIPSGWARLGINSAQVGRLSPHSHLDSCMKDSRNQSVGVCGQRHQSQSGVHDFLPVLQPLRGSASLRDKSRLRRSLVLLDLSASPPDAT